MTEESKNNIFSQVTSKIKSVDGIDEVATLMGHILPGIAGPIATSLVLGIFSPFVWVGAIGMKEEFQEALEELEKILKSKEEATNKLTEFLHFSDKYHKIIKESCGLDISLKKYESSDIKIENYESINELATAIVKFQELQNREIIQALSKKYGWSGIVGMVGMFLAMMPVGFGSEVANAVYVSRSAGSVVAHLTGTILSNVSSGFFLIGQAAMILYAGNKVRQGRKEIEILKESNFLLANDSDNILLPNTLNHLQKIFDRRINFVRNHSTRYGTSTVVGQFFMMVSTTLTLSGIGIPVALPFAVIGAPLATASAILRIISEENEEKFKGNSDLNYASKRISEFNLIKLITEESSNQLTDSKELYDNILGKLELDFQRTINQFSASHLLLMLHNAINDRQFRKCKTVDEKIEKLKKKLRIYDVKNNKKHTSEIEEPVFLATQKLFTDNEELIKKLLEKSSNNQAEANKKLLICIDKVLDCSDKSSVKIDEFLKEDIEKDDLLNSIKSKIGIEIEDNKSDNHLKEISKKIILGAKNGFKAIRLSHADAIVAILKIKQTAQEIANDIVLNQGPSNCPKKLETQILTKIEYLSNLLLANCKKNDKEDQKLQDTKFLEDRIAKINHKIMQNDSHSTDFLQPNLYGGIGVDIEFPPKYDKANKEWVLKVLKVAKDGPAFNSNVAVGCNLRIKGNGRDSDQIINKIRNLKTDIFLEKSDDSITKLDIHKPALMMNHNDNFKLCDDFIISNVSKLVERRPLIHD